MESRGIMTNGKYNGVTVRIEYVDRELTFFAKPKWAVTICGIIGGIVGEALVPAREILKIKISDVIETKFSETRGGNPAFEITVPGDVCKVLFNKKDTLTTVLKEDLIEKEVQE